MKILHVANIKTNLANGMNAVIPQHVLQQAKYVDIRFLNTNNINIDCLKDYQIAYDKQKDFINNLEGFIPDLVIIHGTNYFEYIKIYKKLLIKNIPYVIVPHGCITKQALKKKWFKKKLAYMFFFNRFVQKSIGVQCLSERESDNILIKCNKFIATNGIDIPDIKSKTFNTDKVNLLYIARLEYKIKGLDLLLGAIYKLKDFFRENNVVLKMYGPFVCEREKVIFDEIDKKGLRDIVILNDAIFGEDKINAINNGDLFIQTSRSEGMPVGIIEAMSYGLPCILSEGTTLAEAVIEHEIGYAAQNDTDDIAKAIERAISDRNNWTIKSQNAKVFVKNNFAWDKVAKETVDKYRELLNAK